MALPKDFKVEEAVTGRYTLGNLESGGKVKIRILSDFITGKSVWGDVDGKRVPTRVKLGQSIPVGNIGVNKFTNEPERIKQFIAAVVWNYNTEQVEVLETDKSTIIGQIFDLEADSDWGDSTNYDLSISRTGERMDTKYTVIPSNPKPFKCPKDWSYVNLEALYTNDDPFAQNDTKEQLNPDEIDTDKIVEDIPF